MNEALFYGDIVNTDRIIYTPSDFAKFSLMYLQEIGTLKAQKPHTSTRSNLSSYLFFFVVSGSGMLTYDGIQYELSKDDCVFIDCRFPYSHSTNDNLWSLSWIHFNGPTISNIYQKYIERGGLPKLQPENITIYNDIFKKLYQIASSSSFTRDMEINTELSRLLSVLMLDAWNPNITQKGSKNSSMMVIKQYIDDNYTKKITLDELSERFYINKYYLTRVFKKQFGISIMDYLISVRITAAKNLLRFSNYTAEEIGQMCGIGDIFYFSRVFKKIEGITIREYRKQWL